MPSKKTYLPFLILTVGLMLCLQINQSISAQKLELVVQTGHAGNIQSVAFSPDGKTLASGSVDSTIKFWNIETGQQIKSIEGHNGSDIAFSPDGKLIVFGSEDKTIKLWNIETSQQVKSFNGHSEAIQSVVFSPDGKTLASCSDDGIIKIWNIETGQQIKSLEGHTESVVEVVFSPNGKILASGSRDKTIKLWNVETGKQLKSLEGHTRFVYSVAFSPDGRTLASGSWDDTIKLWNVETGEQVKSLEVDGYVMSVAFSPDGKTLASGSLADDNIKLWNVETGQQIKSLTGHSDTVWSVAFSFDGKILASGSGDDTIKLWNVETGQQVKSLESRTSSISSIAFSSNGKMLASGNKKNTIKLWNIEKGQQIKSLEGHTDEVRSLVFSPDGETLASGSLDGTIKLWNMENAEQLKTLNGDNNYVLSVAFSPDGKTLASGDLNKTVKLWNVETGQLIKSLESHSEGVDAIAFSQNGKILASASDDKTIKLWSVETGQLVKSFEDNTGGVGAIRFSPDGKTLTTLTWNRIVKIWNVETGQLIKSFEDQTDWFFSYLFPPNIKFFVSLTNDSAMKLWDREKKKPLATLISIDKNDWVVIDEDGRFDASDGALKLMHYSYGLQTVDLEQFKDEYFEPGLLQKIFKGERLRAVVPLKDAKLPPEIVSQVFDVKTNKLVVKLKNRGGGFGAVKVFVNDKLAVADARDAKFKANPDTAQEYVELSVDLKNGAFSNRKICELKDGKQECRDNKITVYTSNYLAQFKKSNITSRGTSVFTLGGGDENFKLPTLYAIVGGVSDYAGNDLDLKFAAKDAEDFSIALGLGARQLFCAKETPNCLDKVNITTLSTSGKAGTIQPTKENFRNAFAEIAQKAEPSDIVLVYLSGHGVSLDDTDTYFYLTQEAASTSKEDLTKNYAKISITSNELLCWITTTPCDTDKALTFEGKPQAGNKALRQVIILDTCAAGKAGQTLALIAQKDLSTDQRRAIEFLKDKTGTHILMGSTADQPSYEASKFGQGLLTRALLEGMSGAALEKVNGFVDIQTLFRYAENRVEKLAVGIGGIQKPTNAAPTGKTFVIGQMMPNTQKQIADLLPREKPYILRPSFGNREDNYDILGINNQLAKILNDQNNPLMIKGGEAVLVYLNEENFTGAIKPTGFYTIAGETVTIKVSLYKDGQKVAETFEVIANKNEIAEKLLSAIREKLATLKS